MTEANLVTLGKRGEDFDGFGVLPLLLQIAEMIEGVDYRGVESVVLLGGRTPEQEGIEIKRDVLVEEWNGEVRLRLREQDAVIVSKPRADDGHENILGEEEGGVAKWGGWPTLSGS